MQALDVVKEYYARIDAGEVDWVVDLFADACRYDRAGATYRGKPAVRRFYDHERKVKLTHYDLRFWHAGHDVFVEGAFAGHGSDNSPRRGEFADHWTFNEAGRVVCRRTSLFSGAEFIRA